MNTNALKSILYRTWKAYKVGLGPIRASALTYQSSLATIPMLVLASVLSGHFGHLQLGVDAISYLNRRWQLELPLDQILPILEKTQNIDFSKIGIVGILPLIFIFLSSMTQLEKAFNAMWGQKEHRKLPKRAAIYLPFLAILIFLAAITGQFLQQLLNATQEWLARGIPLQEQLETGGLLTLIFGLLSLGLFIFYITVPKVKVKLIPVAFASLITAFLCMSTLFFAIKFQTFIFTRYSFLYGSLALLPILLIGSWIQWNLILLGCSLTSQIQIIRNRI